MIIYPNFIQKSKLLSVSEFYHKAEDVTRGEETTDNSETNQPGQAQEHILNQTDKEGIAMDEKMDVFARATLFLYQQSLKTLGLEGDLRVVRVGQDGEQEEQKAHEQAS